MFVLPDTFKESNEDYIVVNAMKRFIKCRPDIKCKLGDSRQVLLNAIVKYANSTKNAEEDTLQWVDSVVKEGIKDLYIRELSDESIDYVQNVDDIYQKLEPILRKNKVNHLCNNAYTNSMQLVRFQIDESDFLIYTFYLCQCVFVYDGKSDAKVRWYPITVDIYPESGLIVGRGKPKQNMFEYNREGIDLKNLIKVTPEYRIQQGMQYVLDLLNINCKSSAEVNWKFKNCLYKLLDTYTDTPVEITELIENNKDKIANVINIICDEICVGSNKSDIQSDIFNLVEKYFSINYEDKTIFTRGREAYPLRISATDEEESKVDQKSAQEHPLQSKAIFFDNKKMMQKSQICDGIVFKFKRRNKTYFDEEFKVKIGIKNNHCHIKFFEYTEEVDIQNVLQLFINS
ncbi:hypothetical protein ACQRBH_05870 [Bariatricus sp. SGI.161]|uniref:hypothetical protein n=1 Tax=Bariatricus sp. SGI.161 TaxID=3420550 RepID=UPI003D02F464